MANLAEIRQKYPQYNDLQDEELLDKFHGKFYSDMPKEDFYQKMNYSPVQEPVQPEQEEKMETFLGPMQRVGPEFRDPESPEFKEQIHSLVDIAAMGPGMKMIGKPEAGILSGVLGAGKDLASRTFRKVFPSAKTAEGALAQASKEAELATAEATPVKPGLYDAPTTELQRIESEIGKYINVEAPHNVNISEGITNRVKSIEDYWGDSYSRFVNKIKDAKTEMPELASKMLPSGVKVTEKEGLNPFSDWLNQFTPTRADTNMEVVLAKYKDYRDALSGLKQDMKSPKYGAMEKNAIKAAIQKGNKVKSQIKEALDKGLGSNKNEFERLNKGYSEQVFPLRENPIVKKAAKGKLGENVVKDMRTKEPGMDIVRDIVKQDDELLRNVVGQRYKIKPDEIHSPNQLMREYLDELPEFKDLVTKKEKALTKHAARKDISLEEKIKAEKELARVLKKREKVKGYTKGAAIGTAGYLYGKK